MTAPTLHELNQHLNAALLPETHGKKVEPEAKARAKKTADEAPATPTDTPE